MNPIRYAIGDLTTTQARALRGLHRIEPQRVGIAVAANCWHDTSYAAAEAVMDGLGKGADTTGSSLAGAELLHAATGWLLSWQVREVVILDADTTGAPNLDGAVRWLLSIGIDPVVHMAAARPGGSKDPLDAFTATWPTFQVPLDSILPTAAPPPLAPTTASFPVVPRVDGAVFRSTARRQLDPTDFAVVDQLLAATVDAMRAELDARTTIEAEHLAAMWRRHLNGCRTVDEAVVITRAFQIVTLTRDWHVRVDTPALIATAMRAPRSANRDDTWWSHLDVYRDPAVPAMAALVAEDLFLDEIGPLDLRHVELTAANGWTADVGVPSGVRHIEGPAARMLAAQFHARIAAGAQADDALFLSRKGYRLTQRTMSRLAYTPIAEVGVRTTNTPKLRKSTAMHHARRHGLAITKLTAKGARK